jgi:hypothetical protein
MHLIQNIQRYYKTYSILLPAYMLATAVKECANVAAKFSDED